MTKKTAAKVVNAIGIRYSAHHDADGGEAARKVRSGTYYAQRCLIGASAVMQANPPWSVGRWLTIAALKVG